LTHQAINITGCIVSIVIKSNTPNGKQRFSIVPHIGRVFIFLATSHNEATAIPVKELILLEADDKVIHAQAVNEISPISFSGPGLKNFYRDNLNLLKDSHHINRKYVINLPMVTQIKHNHVILPRKVKTGESTFFRIPILRSGDAKNSSMPGWVLNSNPNNLLGK
jgi:hypothetical protein